MSDRKGPRWRVACINWGNDAAMKAVSYFDGPNGMVGERYHRSWAEAMDHANERSFRMRPRALQLPETLKPFVPTDLGPFITEISRDVTSRLPRIGETFPRGDGVSFSWVDAAAVSTMQAERLKAATERLRRDWLSGTVVVGFDGSRQSDEVMVANGVVVQTRRDGGTLFWPPIELLMPLVWDGDQA